MRKRMRLILLMLVALAAASPAVATTNAGSEDPAEGTGAWPASFTIDQIFDVPSVLHPGLRATIPWTQHDAGSRQILREDTAASDVTSALQQRLDEAIKREDYRMASTLKEQMTATSTLVDAKVWADSPTVASAIEPVTAPGLKRTAAGVWRSIVEGVRSTFSSDLDAAQSLVQATLNRAAQMGSCHVKIHPRQTITGIADCSHWTQRVHSDYSGRDNPAPPAICMTSYTEEWQHNDPWMLLPPCGHDTWATHLKDGATCWAASKEVDGARRARLHRLCASKTEGVKDSEVFLSCPDSRSDEHGHLNIRQRLHHFRTGTASETLSAHGILSKGDFCKVAASTFSEVEASTKHTICQNSDLAKMNVCPSPTVNKFVTAIVVDSTHGHSWVYGRTAGMLHTMSVLEQEWNRTLDTVQHFEFSSQNDVDQGTHNQDDVYGGYGRSHEHNPHAKKMLALRMARKIPNFLGPIGPNQPPARPWDISRYDILLSVADRQRTQGMLTQQQHTQVSEQLVLAGRFHREHAAFESTLQPAWVDSLHTVLQHPVARKIFVWKLQSAGFNVSIVAQFANVQHSNGPYNEKMEVASALEFDLHHPLPASECATEGESVAGADDLAEFVALI